MEDDDIGVDLVDDPPQSTDLAGHGSAGESTGLPGVMHTAEARYPVGQAGARWARNMNLIIAVQLVRKQRCDNIGHARLDGLTHMKNSHF